LRYVKVAVEIENLFGSLDNKIVTEIGGGYGAQAIIISNVHNLNKYVIFDLPEVSALAYKFCSEIYPENNINFLDGRFPSEVHSDFLISNYAFSELNKEIQEQYLRLVILKAKHGYITWNDLSYSKLGGFSLPQLLEIIPDSRIIPEVPLTSENNQILIW
jgi:putative sugar O-methyltransferase